MCLMWSQSSEVSSTMLIMLRSAQPTACQIFSAIEFLKNADGGVGFPSQPPSALRRCVSARGTQRANGFLKVFERIECLIHTGEAQIRDLVQFPKRTYNR